MYDFLDVMANHEPFTDHMLRDWEYSGPDRGVGARARVHVRMGGRTDAIDIEVVQAHRPWTIVERNVGAGGRRVASGTYTLHALPAGGRRIEFDRAWATAPVSERLLSPVVRGVMRRFNQRAMERLAERLASADGTAGTAAA